MSGKTASLVKKPAIMNNPHPISNNIERLAANSGDKIGTLY